MKSKMTEGKIFSKLLLFALPLVIGSIFQLTYNLFDYIILGWFSDNPIFSQAAIGVAGRCGNIPFRRAGAVVYGPIAGAGVLSSGNGEYFACAGGVCQTPEGIAGADTAAAAAVSCQRRLFGTAFRCLF